MKGKRVLEPQELLKLINSFAVNVLQQSSLNEILWLIADTVIAKLGFDDCVIYLVDHSKQSSAADCGLWTQDSGIQGHLGPDYDSDWRWNCGSLRKG